ncbi:MAG: orotate phosphoribosyltransferase [Clostridia bacterium]|nr:orotate phosphoribosyltransferase [Clostridia bacterium]MBO5315784.1 orotate phosphoribosyltransferase [Clostridia bacterium]MBR3806473.1 orotate phosphoribosyltransferase [Clostridia bacterium]
MPNDNSYKIRTKNRNLFLRVSPGHFATNHSHINYYIDVTTQKTRLSEAQAVANALVSYYTHNTIVDTVLCLDGTEVIGTCLADALTRGDFTNLNAHQTIYVITPEHTTGSQLIFRDNTLPAIASKNVLIIAASVTTGYTAKSAVEAIRYYGGNVVGISSIFATVKECMGYAVNSVFDTDDLGDYSSFPSHECPLCRAGKKIDALVNSFGYSKI